MKALSITIGLACAGLAASAQSAKPTQPNLGQQRLQQLLKADTGLSRFSLPRNLQTPQSYFALPRTMVNAGTDAKVYSRMPVAHLKSTDAMPVAALSKTQAMPTKHVTVIDPLAAAPVAVNP